MGLWASELKVEWMGDTPKTVMTTRAPAVLIIADMLNLKKLGDGWIALRLL